MGYVPLPQPFLVLATQNPIEYEGTFPLPEAQLDRFMIRIHLGYPSAFEEVLMLESQQHEHPIERVQQVINAADLINAQHAVKELYVDRLIKEYIVSLVEATRKHPDVYLGASPRFARPDQDVANAGGDSRARFCVTGRRQRPRRGDAGAPFDSFTRRALRNVDVARDCERNYQLDSRAGHAGALKSSSP